MRDHARRAFFAKTPCGQKRLDSLGQYSLWWGLASRGNPPVPVRDLMPPPAAPRKAATVDLALTALDVGPRHVPPWRGPSLL